MEDIKIGCGKEVLNDYDREIIKRLCKEYREKIERHFEINSFEIYVKCHEKKGNIKRYCIDVRVFIPSFRFESSSEEYKLSDAVHKALEKVLNEIEHKAHISSQGNDFRGHKNNRERKR